MSWRISIINNYIYPLTAVIASTGTTDSAREVVVSIGAEITLDEPLGNLYIKVPGCGEANFTDLARQSYCGHDFMSDSYGVLISYQGRKAEYRTGDGGLVAVTVSSLGTIEIDCNGGLYLIDLPPLSASNLSHEERLKKDRIKYLRARFDGMRMSGHNTDEELTWHYIFESKDEGPLKKLKKHLESSQYRAIKFVREDDISDDWLVRPERSEITKFKLIVAKVERHTPESLAQREREFAHLHSGYRGFKIENGDSF